MNANLPIFGSDKNLKEFATSKKDVENKITRLPPDSCRLWQEDVYEPIVAGQKINQSQAVASKDKFEDDVLPTGGDHRATFAKGGDTNA